MTHRLTHALAVLYALTALGLARCAVVSWQNGSQSFALFFAGASVLLMTATIHHSWQRDELRYAHALLKHASRPPELPPAFADQIALGWQALEETCCLRWWESKETEHSQQCTRKGQTA